MPIPTQPDPFPFTEEELIQAFRLVSTDEEARANARFLLEQVAREPTWDASDESLALLALGSISAAHKVAAIREQRRVSRDSWMAIEVHRAGLPKGSTPAWLEAKWAAETETDNRTWNELLSRMRAEFIAQGKLPADSI
jgi:hypothetical protein